MDTPSREEFSHNNTSQDIINFIFPTALQHPLAAARLIIYGLYGPLIGGELKSGSKRNHVIMDWELNSMCLQIEKEDILQVYLQGGQKFELLNNLQQDELINQADTFLKKAKGKAFLPKISKEEIINIFNQVRF